VILSGWANHGQQEIIDFQNAQIRALMAKLGKKRILLTEDQRRLLAVKGKSIGRPALIELTNVVTPDTIMRWHNTLALSSLGSYCGPPSSKEFAQSTEGCFSGAFPVRRSILTPRAKKRAR
jgi:hypothetical protein